MMKTMKVALLAIPLSVSLLSSCARQETTSPAASAQPADSALPAVFGDGADATYDRVDNVHQVRFVEIFRHGPRWHLHLPRAAADHLTGKDRTS